MPFYNSAGKISKKRHTVFKNPKGGIYYEELESREGFSYIYSNLYHLNMPTQVKELGPFQKENKYTYIKEDHKPYHFLNKDSSESKSSDLCKLLLYNKDVCGTSLSCQGGYVRGRGWPTWGGRSTVHAAPDVQHVNEPFCVSIVELIL